jgi:hypothetical protein
MKHRPTLRNVMDAAYVVRLTNKLDHEISDDGLKATREKCI